MFLTGSSGLRDEVEIINKYSIIAVVIAVVTINIIAIPYQIYAQPSTQGNAITGIKVGSLCDKRYDKQCNGTYQF